MTRPIARSRKARSKTAVKRTMPQARATVYSQRLPRGGRSTAMARLTTEAVRRARPR